MRHKPAIDGAKKIARFPHHSCRENTVINASGNAAGNNHMKNPTCCLYLGRSMDRRGYYQPTHTWFKSQPVPAEPAEIQSVYGKLNRFLLNQPRFEASMASLTGSR